MDLGFDTSRLKAYSGYFNDNEKLLQSASGGGATAIAEAFLSRGGIVFGVSYSQDFKSAEFVCASTPGELAKLKGSKYIESRKEILIDNKLQSIYKVVAEKLKSNNKVLFIGLGCEVAAMQSYLDTKYIDTTNLYLIDLICHGPTSPEVARQFIEKLEKKFKSKVISFSVRYKKKGWTPPYIFALFENGKTYETHFYGSDYGYAFSIYSRPSCYNCHFRGENHKSNLTLADYWGLTKEMEGYNPNGVSLFIVQNPKGEELIESINNNEFTISPTDVDFALANNTMYFTTRKPHPNREKFEKNLMSKGLGYATKKSYGTVKYYLIRKLKIRSTIGRLLPMPIKRLIRKI